VTAGGVGYGGVAASLVLVVVAVVLSLRQGLGIERTIVWAVARAFVQLLAVGSALTLVLADDAPVVLALGWVALMVLVASVTIALRAREVPDMFPVGLLAVGSAVVVSELVLFGLGIFPFEPVAIVPLAGMVLGNSLGATVTASRRVVDELSDNRIEVEARLALGQPWKDAARPYVRSAVRTALTVQIESVKTLGLIALPGAMTGLILAGVDPIDAVLVQMCVMYVILGSAATATAVVGVGATRRLFTSDHRLRPLARSR